jgi:hypothetical protein
MGMGCRRLWQEVADQAPLGQLTERIVEADNRVKLTFPGKPSDAVRSELKSSGFRWAPSEGVWQRNAGSTATYHAERIAKMHAGG